MQLVRKNKILGGSFTLAMGTFMAKLIGAIYRIPLTNMLGSFGLGLYQMIFPVYSVLLDFSGAGVPSALSRLISSVVSNEKEQKAVQYLSVSIRIFILMGIVGSLIMAIGASPLSKAQGNGGATQGYLFLSPSVLLVCVLSCFRGYFQGFLNMKPTALSQITEQLIKLLFGLLFVSLLLPNVKQAVAGATFAITLSELVALIQLYITYKKRKKETNFSWVNSNDGKSMGKIKRISLLSQPIKEFKSIAKKIIKTTIPITLTGIIIPISQVIDSLLIINLLSTYRTDATSLYGLLTGVVATVINLPVSLCYGIATTTIPTVSALKTEEAKRKTTVKSLLLTAICALIFSVACFLLARLAVGVLFRNLSLEEKQTAVSLLRLCAPNILLLSLLQTSNAALIGKGRLYLPVITMSVAVVIKTILSIILLKIPSINIYGGGIALIACYFIACLLNLILIFTVRMRDGNKRTCGR